MRRVLQFVVILLILSILFANVYASEISLYVENVKLELENKPFINNGYTLVPVRAIFENLGATVEWDGINKTVTGKTENKTVVLKIDNKIATVNGVPIELAVPAQIINGSTYVPVRFVAESLGAEVNWDNNTRSVLVNSDYPYGKYNVTRVVDGDTIELDFNGTKEKVRLIGIDAPESVHPDADKNVEAGKIVSEYTKEKLEGKEIALEFDVQERDQYGRLLAYVWVDGEMYNKHLLSVGYAQVSTYPPNIKYVNDFIEIQRNAREGHIGLWGETIETKEQNATPKQTPIPSDVKYIGNANTKKFHYPECSSVNDMKESNKIAIGSRDDAIKQGYIPCKRCNP